MLVKDSNGDIDQVEINEPRLVYLLHYTMRMYFANGGGPCYVVSVNGYDAEFPGIKLSGGTGAMGGLLDGLDALKSEDETTLIVVPESVNSYSDADYQMLVQTILGQCGELKNRFAVFDLLGGGANFVPDSGNQTESVEDNNSLIRNREFFGTSNLKLFVLSVRIDTFLVYPYQRSLRNSYDHILGVAQC